MLYAGILYFLVIFALINVLQNGNLKKSEELMALSLPLFALGKGKFIFKEL